MLTSYQEFKPSPALQPYVENYWLLVFDGVPGEEAPMQRCLPLGMTQIIVHLDRQDCRLLVNDEWERLPGAFFVGLYKDVVTMKSSGSGATFGLNIRPESLLQLFNVPAAALFSNYTDISSFLSARINTFAGQMKGVLDAHKLVNIMETYLLNRLKDMRAERTYITEATNMIRRAKGNISIEALCKNLYVSERQLQRTFKDALGTSPKVYTRIIRFRNAYQYVRATKAERLSWASLSYDFGYADQAHFIRDFKEFTGAVPSLVVEDKKQFYQLTTGVV